MLKALFVLQIFTFWFWPFGYLEKWLGKKDKVNFKTYGITGWITNIIIPQSTNINISRSKGNQTMKFDQLIEYNMRNILLKKSYPKYDEEAIPRFFFKKSKLSIFLDQQAEMSYSLFLFYVQFEGYQNILILKWWPLVLNLYKAFSKNKKTFDLVRSRSFSAWFLKKKFFAVQSFDWPNFID